MKLLKETVKKWLASANVPKDRRGGFTLIELLVVIAIIAILASILLPVIAHAKLKATEAYCLNNQKQICAGWLMYADDNKENLLATYNSTGASIFASPLADAGGFWGINQNYAPFTSNNQGNALTNELICLQYNNSLGSYLPNPQVFHCPGDQRFNLPIGQGWAFDSYAVPENVEASGPSGNDSFATMAAIKRPTGCAVIVEQADTRGYNEGTFEITANSTNSPGSIGFKDMFALYHGDVGTFAFADGHAVAHRWINSVIIAAGNYSIAQGSPADTYQNAGFGTPPSTGPDADFIYQSFESPSDP